MYGGEGGRIVGDGGERGREDQIEIPRGRRGTREDGVTGRGEQVHGEGGGCAGTGRGIENGGARGIWEFIGRWGNS